MVTKTQTERDINKNGKSSIHCDKRVISMGGEYGSWVERNSFLYFELFC